METADEKPYAGKCLLLVDDDAEASASQAEILGLMGAEVERIIVRPGAFPEAVAEVRAKLLGQRFDLALIDNNLPGRDLGQSLIKRIVGQIGDHNPVRLVLLTADAALGGVPYDREALRAKGLVGMVHRPLTHQALQCLLSGEDVWEAEAPSSEASTAGHVPLAAQPGTAAAPTPRTILDGIAVQPAVRFALLVRARRRIEARDLIGAGAIPFSLENYSDALARTELRMLVDGPIASLDIRARDAGNEMLRIGSSGIAHWRIIPLGATPWVFGVGVADEQDVASRLPLWISALTATLEVQQWREWAHHVSSFVQLGMAHQGLSHEVFNLQSEFRDLLRTLSRRIALIKPQHQLQEDAKSKIEETVLKLVHASQELLEFSKRQLREQALRLREVYVPEATATIRRIVAEEFREAEVALHLGTPPALALPAPNAALVLPLVNLLINAAKHHYRAENRRVELLFDLGDVNGNPELIADVRDNGPGLDQTALERLWEPGFSTPPDSERRHGMGLWLARRLVEEAGGSLVLHQHWRGLGAWFRLRLPIKPRMTEREPFLIDKDVEVAPRVLLVIDDSEAFRESIELEGEYRGWTVMASDDMQEVLGWLPKHLPDAVLLDWNLPGQQRRDFTKMLRERELTKRTLLLSSGEMDDPRRKLISEFGLAGFKLKPLDLDRLDEEIRLPKRSQEWPGLEAMAYQVDVCIDILDHSLNPRWSNADAREEPLTLEQRLIVQWLRAYIIDRKHKAARRLDWDGRKQCFLESRLFTLRNGDFWLARDWRDKSDRPHDHELLNIDRSDELKDWLQAVARLLAQRYAISRFRVYKIAPLTGTASSRERMEPLIMPLFQSGGGFATSDGVWLGSGFLASENPAVHRALAEDYEPAPEHVTDESPNVGCKEIRYGPQGTSRVLFPVHNEHGAPVALFALDRRLDHAEKLEGFDREVVQIATRMASDEAGVLSNEQWSLMKGLVEDIGERLMTRRLRADEDRREKEWHEAISTAMRDTFSEAGRSPEMTYEGLSQICAQLRDAWAADEISGD